MIPQGWTAEQFMRNMHRYGVASGAFHAWPNCETRIKPGVGRVWGAYFWPHDSHLVFENIRGPAPGLGIPGLTPIADAWRAAHRYAKESGYETAMPTYEAGHLVDGTPLYGLVMLQPFSGLEWRDVPRADLSLTRT